MDTQITIDSDLEELIPTYLENLQKNMQKIREFLSQSDFESIRVLGHNMKGSGSGYGLDFVTESGIHIEEASKLKEAPKIESALNDLDDFLKKLKISYTP